MAERAGDIVFRVDQSDIDSDIWDDSALIKAYDKAISSVKGMTKGDNDGKASKNVKHKKAKRGGRKKNKKQAMQMKWKRGDCCKAVFSEDKQVYSAVVLSVNHKKGSCIVQYSGYGNEEEKRLSDLFSESEAESQSNSAAVLENGYDSMEWTDHSQSPMHPTSGGSGTRKRVRPPGPPPPPQHPYQPPFGPPPHPHGPSPARHPGPYGASSWYPPPPPMPPPPLPMTSPAMSPLPFAPWGSPNPHMYPGWGASTGPTASHQTPPRIPPMPSTMPPHPPLPEDVADIDNEALHSMLMSWYMSGYHTGYYQGLKEAKPSMRNTSKNEPSDATPKQDNSRQRRSKVKATLADRSAEGSSEQNKNGLPSNSKEEDEEEKDDESVPS